MIAIIDNGDVCSSHAIYFVRVASREEADHLVAVYRALRRDEAHLLGVSPQIEWLGGDIPTTDVFLREEYWDDWAIEDEGRRAHLDAVPLAFLERFDAIAGGAGFVGDEWNAYLARRRQ